jgi:hypothetical protein
LKKASLVVLALVALAAIVIGCGDSDDGGSETTEATETLTKAEFIKRGDAICEEANEQNETEAEEFAKEKDFTLEKATDEQLEEAITEVLVPSLNQQAEDIKALGAPQGDEGQVDKIIVSLEDGASEIEDDPSLAFEGRPLKESSRLADDYGFEVCGQE